MSNFQPQQKPPYRGLILAANILGGFLLFAFLVVAVVTSVKHQLNKALYALQDEVHDQLDIAVADSVTSVSAFPSDPNERTYDQLRNNIPDTAGNRQELFAALPTLNEESDRMYNYLQLLHDNFNDTVNSVYGSTGAVSTEYFIHTGRAAQLKDELYKYRNTVLETMQHINGSTYDLKSSLPMDDTPVTGYTTGWDDSNFYGSTNDAMYYLEKLKEEVRNFEGAALNQVPYTHGH